MVPAMTRAEAAAALAVRTAERDRIQENLLDLDASFGKRLLAGAALTGVTKQQWDAVAADLASVWDVFGAYSATVQRAAEIIDGTRRPGGPLLAELTSLLTGPSVVLAGREVPLAQRQLTGSGRPEEHVNLDQAAQRMATAFGRIAEVTSAAENVWNEVSKRLAEISAALGPATQRAAALADEELRGEVSALEAQLERMRNLLNCDPLALWHEGRIAVSGLDQLLRHVRSVDAMTAELARLREDAVSRIAEAAHRVATAQACEQDARTALHEAAQKIAAGQLPAMPASAASLTGRLADLDALRAAGRLQRLATELAVLEKDAAAAATRWRDAEAAARALLDRRGELRGLLDAYRAKAGRIGAAEDAELAHRYEVARDLLWSAPCDLAASAEAVRTYQEAVLAMQRGER